MQDLQIKTFLIRNEADERAMNEFLAGKVVRHWSTSFQETQGAAQADSPGTWNVFVAFELRTDEPRAGRQEHTITRKPQEARGGNRGYEQRDNKPRERFERQERPERSEKPTREEYQPQVPEADAPVFEAVRKWRNARARDERVKPFSFFNNRQLEEVVKAKPTNVNDLRTLLPDMEPQLWERYHNELLGFMEAAAGGASSGSGVAEPALQPAASEGMAN